MNSTLHLANIYLWLLFTFSFCQKDRTTPSILYIFDMKKDLSIFTCRTRMDTGVVSDTGGLDFFSWGSIIHLIYQMELHNPLQLNFRGMQRDGKGVISKLELLYDNLFFMKPQRNKNTVI